jgi:hypothetical protein
MTRAVASVLKGLIGLKDAAKAATALVRWESRARRAARHATRHAYTKPTWACIRDANAGVIWAMYATVAARRGGYLYSFPTRQVPGGGSG